VPILERAKIEHSIFHQVQGTLSRLGFDLQQHHSILDFGCGSGHDVYELRDIGYQAFGVDLHDFLQLRSPDDRQWFRLSRDPCIYRLPYPDNHFDVIYSNQVLEHVVYYEPALQEMRRVLKPNGICIHIFPARWRVIEAHFRAPFAGSHGLNSGRCWVSTTPDCPLAFPRRSTRQSTGKPPAQTTPTTATRS
jgi:SAM-dependent methyltransferase